MARECWSSRSRSAPDRGVPGHLEVCWGACSERLGLQCVLRHYGVGRIPGEVCQVSLLTHSLLEQGFGKSL